MSAVPAASQQPATAAETDPESIGWMQGFPPPPDKLITFHNGSFRSFPELRWAWSNLEIVAEHVVAEGEWVMGRCTSSAIHSTSVMGVAPTNRRIETTFWDLHRFNQDGLIVETWNVVDGLAIMQQLKAGQGG